MTMLSHVKVIAGREYRAIVRTRAFRVTLVGLPLMMALVTWASTLMSPPVGEAYAIIDRSGTGEAARVEQVIETDYQRGVMNRLAVYAKGRESAALAAGKAWATGPRWFSDAEVTAFIADGGADGALKTLSAADGKASPFDPPDRRFLKAASVALPADATPEAFRAAYPPNTKPRTMTEAGKRPLSLALYIPEGFERGEPIQAFTNGRANPYLLNIVQAELTRALRARAVEQAGLDPAAVARLNAVAAPMVIIAPPSKQTSANALKSALPSMLAYILMITVSITGSMLLQSVMEERGNKLLESVLACVTPHELMYGKLFGICAVGLTVIATWGAFAAIAFRFAPPEFQSVVQGILATMNSPMLLAAILFYYFAGYFMVSLLFLAIGAIADSMQDAQGYLTPLMLALILPFALVLPRAMQDSTSLGPVIMSWIPLYTPFAMLSRLGNGVPLPEVLGTSAVLLAFLALEFWLIGKLFKNNLLRTGQPKPFAWLRGKPKIA